MAGILSILLAWQIMSRIFDLDLLLPPPLTVLRNVVVTLTVSNSHWYLRTSVAQFPARYGGICVCSGRRHFRLSCYSAASPHCGNS
jgi:hypothetical protein